MKSWYTIRARASGAEVLKLSKRLDLARDAERAVDGVPGLIVAKWVDVRSGL